MKGDDSLRVTALLLLVGLVGLSEDLRWAWQHSPYDRLGWLVAVVWLGVVAVSARSLRTVPVLPLLLVGIGAGFVSFVGELNVARHLALVAVVAAWMPTRSSQLFAAVAGLSWWPALGWAAARVLGAGPTIGLRVVILMVGLIALRRGLSGYTKNKLT